MTLLCQLQFTFTHVSTEHRARMTRPAALSVAVVVAVLMGSFALAQASDAKLRVMAEMIRQEKAMADLRSTHWGANMTTVSEGGRVGKDGRLVFKCIVAKCKCTLPRTKCCSFPPGPHETFSPAD